MDQDEPIVKNPTQTRQGVNTGLIYVLVGGIALVLIVFFVIWKSQTI